MSTVSDAEDKVSEYRIVSKSCFRNRRGQPVKLIYATRTSEVFPVPLAIAQALDRGEAGSVLTEQERTSLRRREILVPADENELDVVTGRLQQGADDVGHRHLALLPDQLLQHGLHLLRSDPPPHTPARPAPRRGSAPGTWGPESGGHTERAG